MKNININSNLTALVLCGGKGERLYPITKKIPKPLVKLKKKEILSYLIDHLRYCGIKDIIIASGYKHKLLKNFVRKKYKSKNIKIINSGINTEIIKRVEKILKYSKNNLLICYGDTLANINIKKLYKYHTLHKYPVTISSFQVKSNFGILKINKNNIINSYIEKPYLNIWFNIGYMIFSKKIFSFFSKFEKFELLLKYLVKKSKIKTFKHRGLHITINTLKELEEANREVGDFEKKIK